MPKVAELIMRHIAGLWAKYSQYKHLPVFIVPENNTEYAAYGLDLHIMDINLQRQCLFEHNENIQVLYEKDQHGTKAMLAGIHTHSGSKTNGVTRLGARLKRGPTSICLSREFGSNTTTSDGSQMQPTEDMLARMRREFRSFRTIPPTLENKKKVVTYNGKCIGETDDFIMALLMVDLGNAEIEKQALMLIG